MVRPIVNWLIHHWYVIAGFWMIILAIGIVAWKRFSDIINHPPPVPGTEDYEAWLRGDTHVETIAEPKLIPYLFHYEFKKNGILTPHMEERQCLDDKAAHDLFFTLGKELGVTTDNLRTATYHRKDQAPSSVGRYRGYA